MALILTGIQRENGANCDHLIITAIVEGVQRAKKFTMQAILDGAEDEDFRISLVCLWLRYQKEIKGLSNAQITALLPATVVA
jgi:hypothetical protein